MTEGEVAILTRLADTAQQQAATAHEQAVITLQLIAVLEKVDAHLTRMDDERDKAVSDIKTEVVAALKRSDLRLMMVGGVIALAEILREPVGKLISLVAH